jgi:hypothetical protein
MCALRSYRNDRSGGVQARYGKAWTGVARRVWQGKAWRLLMMSRN